MFRSTPKLHENGIGQSSLRSHVPADHDFELTDQDIETALRSCEPQSLGDSWERFPDTYWGPETIVGYDEGMKHVATSCDPSLVQTLPFSHNLGARGMSANTETDQQTGMREGLQRQARMALNNTPGWRIDISDHVYYFTYNRASDDRQRNSGPLMDWVAAPSFTTVDTEDALSLRSIETPSTIQNTDGETFDQALIAELCASPIRPVAEGEASSPCFGKAGKEKGCEVWTSFGYVTIGFATCKRAGTIDQRAGSIFGAVNNLAQRKVFALYLESRRAFLETFTELLHPSSDQDFLMLMNDRGIRDLNKTTRQLSGRLPTFKDAVMQGNLPDSITDGLLKKVHSWSEILMIAHRLKIDRKISDSKKLGYWYLGRQER